MQHAIKDLREWKRKLITDPKFPIDLIIEIFLRLSVKSIAIYRCVSKIWASILRRPYFTELFLTMALARLQLLFVCQTDCKLFIFSSPQPQNWNENSSLVSPNYRMNFGFAFRTSKFRSQWLDLSKTSAEEGNNAGNMSPWHGTILNIT